MEIKVLGTGCKNCLNTAELISRKALQHGIAVTVEKVTDLAAIAAFGVMSAPAVVIDGKVVHAGGVPKESDVDNWLQAKGGPAKKSCGCGHSGCCG